MFSSSPSHYTHVPYHPTVARCIAVRLNGVPTCLWSARATSTWPAYLCPVLESSYNQLYPLELQYDGEEEDLCPTDVYYLLTHSRPSTFICPSILHCCMAPIACVHTHCISSTVISSRGARVCERDSGPRTAAATCNGAVHWAGLCVER